MKECLVNCNFYVKRDKGFTHLMIPPAADIPSGCIQSWLYWYIPLLSLLLGPNPGTAHPTTLWMYLYRRTAVIEESDCCLKGNKYCPCHSYPSPKKWINNNRFLTAECWLPLSSVYSLANRMPLLFQAPNFPVSQNNCKVNWNLCSS